MVLAVKNLSANVGDIRDAGSIPGSLKSPGGGLGNALQYSCLENPRTAAASAPDPAADSQTLTGKSGSDFCGVIAALPWTLLHTRFCLLH